MYILIALGMLLAAFLFNLFVGAELQANYAVWGMSMTEIAFALLALAASVAMILHAGRRRERGCEIAEIHSVRPPRPRHVLGGILLIAASYFIAALYSNILAALLPEQLQNTVDHIQTVLFNQSLPVMLFAVAVLPAICEELMFRGVVQYAFSRQTSPGVAAVVAGVFFGMFHMDPLRVPLICITGLILSYALLRSRSIFVPMLMHFLNNAVSAVVTYSLRGSTNLADAVAEQAQMAAEMGVSMRLLTFISAAEITGLALALLGAGAALMESDAVGSLRRHRGVVVAAVVVVLLLGVGFALTALQYQ